MAAFMPHVDFGWSLVATAPSPASSGTSLIVTAGQGTNFPDPALVGPYIATVCPANSLPTWANAEEVLVTAKATDTFTITRAQGTTSARTIVVGDQFFLGIVAKVIKDIEAALDNSVCDFRLTLTSGAPVTSADVTGAATLYCAPYKGNRIALYSSTFSAWLWDTSAEFSIALGTLVNAQAYDVFCYDNAGVPTLELLEWANAVVTMTIASPGVVTWTGHGMSTAMSITFTNSGGALPTGVTANTQYWITVVDANTFKLSTSLKNCLAGTFVNTSGSQSGTHTGHQPQARQTALTKQDGVLVKTGATSRRYLGAFMTTSTTTTEDSATKAFLSNYYNRLPRRLLRQETTASWTYSTATRRQANDSVSNQLAVFIGAQEVVVDVTVIGLASNDSTQNAEQTGVGFDSTTTQVAGSVQGLMYSLGATLAGAFVELTARCQNMPTVGYHVYTWLELPSAGGVTTWYGTSNSGMYGSIQA